MTAALSMSPLVEIGLTDLSKSGGAMAPWPNDDTPKCSTSFCSASNLVLIQPTLIEIM